MEAQLTRWQEDDVLNNYREGYLAEDKIPTIDELKEILTFLAIFVVGFNNVGLTDLATTYQKRFDLVIVGAIEMGYPNTMYYRAGVTVYSPLARAIQAISYQVHPEY